MGFKIVLTDGNGVQGLALSFGAFINTSVAATAADALAAAQSAAAALASQTAAALSESNAAASAATATAQATTATGAAATATTQAGISTTQAGIATTQAGNASTSAGTATTQAGIATTQAGIATTQAGNAATSAAAAAATLANALTKANNLSDVANVATARTNLGLGTAAVKNTGTSGNTIPFLDGTNTWANQQTMTVRPIFNGQTPYDTGNVNPFSLVGKNRIINGSCTIQQRGPSAAIASGATGYGGPDRYRVALNGTPGGTCTQSASTITFNGVVRPAVLQTVTSVATNLSTVNYWSGIVQIIEGYNAYDLVGQPVAVSFIFQASVTGTYSVVLRDSTGSYSYVATITVSVANTPQQYTVLVSAIPAAANIPCSTGAGLHIWIGADNSGTYATSTLNAWQNANYIVASGRTSWTTVAGATIALTELQLEAGPIATPFERRSFTTEVQLCQRYYQTLTNVIVNGYGTASGIGIFSSTPFPTFMRSPPTTTVGSITATNATGYGANSTSSNAVFMQATTAAAGAALAYANLQFASEL